MNILLNNLSLNSCLDSIQDKFPKNLNPLQKKVALIVFAYFSCATISYLIYQYYVRTSTSPLKQYKNVEKKEFDQKDAVHTIAQNSLEFPNREKTTIVHEKKVRFLINNEVIDCNDGMGYETDAIDEEFQSEQEDKFEYSGQNCTQANNAILSSIMKDDLRPENMNHNTFAIDGDVRGFKKNVVDSTLLNKRDNRFINPKTQIKKLLKKIGFHKSKKVYE